MKKRFLSILTALCLTLTLLPTAALADGAVREVSSEQEFRSAITDASSGDTVKLMEDIWITPTGEGTRLTPQVSLNTEVTLDLNGYTLGVAESAHGQSLTYTPVLLSVETGAKLTITGNGTITSECGNNNSYCIDVNGGGVVVENGKFYGAVTAIQVESGNLIINGGTFDLAPTCKAQVPDYAKYVVNCIDKAFGDNTATISITGGTFVNFDPSDNPEGTGTSYVAESYTPAIDVDGNFEILSESDENIVIDKTTGNKYVNQEAMEANEVDFVSKIGNEYYETLQAAIEDASTGETVALLRDTKEDITVSNNKKITLDLGTYTLTNANSDTITVEIGSELTIEGSGTVDNKTNARAAIFNNGTVTLNGGTYDRTSETGESADVSGGNSWYTICNHGEMTINAGATVKNTGSFSSMIENGYYSYDDTNPRNGYGDGTNHKNPKLTINNGTFIGGLNSVKNDDGGILVINGGSFSNTTQAAVLNWNEATITGGTFIVESTGVNAVLNGASSMPSTENDKGKLEITGGNFVSPSAPIRNYFTGTTKPVVSGGNFSSSISKDFLAEELKAELYSTSKNSQAPYSYYVSVSAALEDAKAGDTVVDLTAQQGPEKYTVTLRYGNGEADTTYTELAAGTTLALPTPTRTDYRFDGWYVNGNRYTNSYPVNGNATLVAQWTYVGSSSGSSSDPSYSPILDVSDGGSIKVNPRTPEEDDEVTITVDPDSGYEVDEVTVTDRNGREVKVTAERDGTYTFTQPRGRVTISVTFVREGGSTFFSDVPESFWAYDEIAWAYDNGYVNGTSASSFSPNASISRQQVWMILARLSGADPANMSAAREWAVTNGVSDGTTPGGAVTRQQLVALLYRYATLMGYANDQRADLSAYPDAGTVAGYAVEPMQWSVANSIVGGTSNGTLDPTGTATRAQFAVILYRFWDQVG